MATARPALESASDDLLARLRAIRSDEEQLEIARLQATLTTAETRYNSIVTRAQDARFQTEQTKSDVSNRLKFLDPPQVPVAPEGRMKKAALTLATFMVLGILLAFAGVVVATALDRSIRFASDLKNLELRVLSIVPESKELRVRSGRRSARRVAEPALEREPLVARSGSRPIAARERPVTASARPDEGASVAPAPPVRRQPERPAADRPRPAANGSPRAERPPVPPPPPSRSERPAARTERAPQSAACTVPTESESQRSRPWAPGRRAPVEPRPDESNGSGPGWPKRDKPGDIPRAG